CKKPGPLFRTMLYTFPDSRTQRSFQDREDIMQLASRHGNTIRHGRIIRLGRTIAAALLTTGIAITTPAFAQKSADTLRISVSSPMQNLDTHMDPHVTSRFFSKTVFDNLVGFDPVNRKYTPLLAKSWKRIDPKTMEFTLREDVTWHDGAKFDADDVVYTINWMRDPKTRFRFKFQYGFIKNAEKTGSYTVRVHYNRPEAADLAIFSEAVPIYPQHVRSTYKQVVRFGVDKPIGTGQYKALEVKPGVSVLLEKNPDYKLYAPTNPPSNIKRLRFINMPDTGTQMASLLAGQLDMSRDLTPEEGANIVKSNPDMRLDIGQGVGIVYIAFDSRGRTGVKALQDVRVRKALLMSIDRKALQQLLLGDAKATDLPSPGAMCFKVQAGCKYTTHLPPHNLAAAKKLLAEAGYGKGLTLEITTFAIPITKTVAQAVAGFFAKAGVRATIDAQPITAYRKKQSAGRIQVMIGPWPGGGIPDVNQTLSFIFDTPPSRDYHGDEAMRKNAKLARSTLDDMKRNDLAQKVFDRATTQAYMAPLTGFPSTITHHKSVSVGRLGLHTNYGRLVGDFNWVK
ncbi:MAG: hypothetical protein KDJ29_16280, partial [Hyphomicrobiales bacterium]|nr:hypothetical protein [Hyphomicrobiales bacterium]